MNQGQKTFYVYDQAAKRFKKMFFASPEPTGKISLNESSITKVTTVDISDQKQELGEMEF